MYKLNSDGVSARKLGTLEDHLVSDSTEYLDWIAAGNTPEAADPPDAAAVALSRIDHMERAHMAPRWLREFALEVIEDKATTLGVAQGLTKQQSLAILSSKNSGYARVKTLDADIAVLREALK